MQLSDEFYKKSGFDKGHMSRREDAEWGKDINFAKLAADLSCSYTNAAPQVPGFNRNMFQYKGLWGRLENEILEKGALKEEGKTFKICVFNGPIFDDENDPVFKSVQISMCFFKVVVWFNSKKQLKATAFKLCQRTLVSDIDFEALQFDTVFPSHQCSIESIERATGLKFHSSIKNKDTFDGGENGEPVDERFLEKLFI